MICTECGRRVTGELLIHLHPGPMPRHESAPAERIMDPASGRGISIDTTGVVTDLVCDECRPAYLLRFPGARVSGRG